VFFIKKKEGSLCLVQDYWRLNEIMVKNSYPLPLVSNMLTRLCCKHTKRGSKHTYCPYHRQREGGRAG